MNLTQDKIDLISRIIKSDRKYSNNEDLYEDFLSEACHRSSSILNVIEDENTLEPYLKRVISTSIINVLKNSGRLRRSKSGYMSTKELIYENNRADEVANYSNYSVGYDNIKIPQTPEDVAIQREILESVAQTVKKVDAKSPDKLYSKIYLMRYEKGMTQKEISQELGISQSEISKRLYALLDKVKSVLN